MRKKLLLLILSPFLVALLFVLPSFLPKNKNLSPLPSCPTKTETLTVNGSSLSPLLNHGSEITALFGYYSCHEIERNDLVLYKFSGNKNPLIKIVRGIPGDRFEIKDDYIYINNSLLKNSENNPYIMDSRAKTMLSLYINDYKGIIPKDTYLLLGNQTSGSLDSTRFGLVSKNDILGKAVPVD